MSAVFDPYVPGHSWLHRADARVKVVFALLTAVLLLIWSWLPLLLTVLLVTHLALLAIGFGPRRIGAIWRALAPFLLMILVLWPLFNRGGSPMLLELGPVRITGEAVLRALATASRMAAISFVFVLWLSTTDQRALVRAFVRLGLPFKLGMSLTIGLRFIPTFAGLFRTVSEAQQARGLVLEGRGFKRAKSMIPILVAALVSALRLSEQLGWTLEARAFGAPVRRTTLHDLRMRRLDWFLLIALLAGFALLLGLTLARGLGR